MREVISSAQQVEDRARWKWFLAVGILLLFLGIAGAGATTFLELTSLLVFGPMMLASSFLQLLTAFFAEKRKESLLHLATAGLEAILGFLIMAQPLLIVPDLVVLIAIFFMAAGLARLPRSVATQSRGRAWIAMTGVIALLLAIAVWIGWPVGQLWFVGLCIAIDIVCQGVGWSALALADRNPLHPPAHYDTRPAEQPTL